MNEKLKSTIECLPLFKQLFSNDIFLTVVDSDHTILGFLLPDGAPATYSVGDELNDDSGDIASAVKTGKKQHISFIDDEKNVKFEGDLIPITDNSKVVGILICSYKVDESNSAEKIAKNFDHTVATINSSFKPLVKSMNELTEILENTSEIATNVDTDVSNALGIVKKISSNASRSNILALNASIEAARSGQAGGGFAVVADQMGKLANDSGSSAKEINQTLELITEHLATIIKDISSANEVSKAQMTSINEIRNSLEEAINLVKGM